MNTEGQKKVACLGCGRELASGQVVCPACGHHAGSAQRLDEAPPLATNASEATPPPTCPECGAEMGVGAILCIACGHHLGLGRRLRPEPDDDVQQNVPDSFWADPARRLKIPTLPPATLQKHTLRAGAVFLVGLFVVLGAAKWRKAAEGKAVATTESPSQPMPPPASPAPIPPPGQAPGQVKARPLPAPKPKVQPAPPAAKITPKTSPRRSIGPLKLSRLAPRVAEMSEEELARKVLILKEEDRHLVAALYVHRQLARWPLSRQDLEALCARGRKVSVKGSAEAIGRHLKKSAATAVAWDPLWSVMLDALPPQDRALAARPLAASLQFRSLSVPVFRTWLEALSEYQDEATEQLAPPPAVVDQLLSSVVLLRCQQTPHMGVVMARSTDVTVLTGPLIPSDPPEVSRTGNWAVAVTKDGKRHWLPASHGVDVWQSHPGRGRTNLYRLLRFPLVDQLATAIPARPDTTADAMTIAVVGPPSLPGTRMNLQCPLPPAWKLQLVPSGRSPAPGYPNIGTARFSGPGRVVAMGRHTQFQPSHWEEILAPHPTVGDVFYAPGTKASLVVNFPLVDLRQALVGATALVGPPSTERELKRVAQQYQRSPRQTVLPTATSLPVTCGPDGCQLRIPDCPTDGTPFLVQLLLELPGKVILPAEPTIVYPRRRTPASGRYWLGSKSRRELLAAQREQKPLPTARTVAGGSRRYGRFVVQDLYLEAMALVPDADHAHIHVAGSEGIRRISLGDFRETAGLPLAQPARVLAGTAQGLVTATIGDDGKPILHILDPASLESRRTMPIDQLPTELLGDWQSTLLVMVNRENLTVVDLTGAREPQRLTIAELLVPPAGKAHEKWQEGLVATHLQARAGQLYILGSRSLRRLPITDRDGLAKPAPGNILIAEDKLAQFPCPFGVRTDAEYLFVRNRVYDLRQRTWTSLGSRGGTLLGLDAAKGYLFGMWSSRSGVRYEILDRRGTRIAFWPSHVRPPVNGRDGNCSGVFLHPDGRHCLLWGNGMGSWVTLPPSEKPPGATRPRRSVQ